MNARSTIALGLAAAVGVFPQVQPAGPRSARPAMTRTAAAAAPPGIAATHPELDWRFSYPDADFVVSVDIGSLLKSPYGASIPAALAAQKGMDEAKTREFNRAWAMLAHVDRIAISVRQRPGRKDSDGLILISGRLQESGIPAVLASNAKAPKPRYVNANTIILGEDADADAALDRMRGVDGKQTNELTARARRMSGEYDLWIGGSLSAVASAVPAKVSGSDLLSGLTHLSFGMSWRANTRLALTLRGTNRALEQLMSFYQNFEAGLTRSGSGAEEWKQHLKVERTGNEIAFRMEGLPGKEANAGLLLAAALKPHLASMFSEMQPAPAKRVPQPPARNTIIIDGLDEGRREIPFPR